MKRIVITGPNGFLGRQAIPFLIDRGYEIHALDKTIPDNNLPGHAPDRVIFHKCDLLDNQPVEKLMKEICPEHLLHFAWYVVPGKFWHAIENLQWVAASLRLFQNFIINGGKRIVFAGTCAEYDWGYSDLSEKTTPLNPSTFYGVAKNELRSIVEKTAEQFGVSMAWGRIFFLYGPHEQRGRLVPDIINNLLQGKPARSTLGRQLRDFMHVRDVARAFVDVLESDWTGAVNIASGDTVTIAEVVRKLGEITGRSDLLKIGVIPASPSDPECLSADVHILKDVIGYKPEYDLTGGLENTVDWWKKLQPLAD